MIVAACVPGEAHDLGLRMVAGLYQAGGREVHFLGGDVPIESILYAIRLRRATTLLLSVTLAQAIPALETTLRAVAMLPEGQRPRVVVGGQAVAGHEDEIRRLGAEAADDQVPADLAGSPE